MAHFVIDKMKGKSSQAFHRAHGVHTLFSVLDDDLQRGRIPRRATAFTKQRSVSLYGLLHIKNKRKKRKRRSVKINRDGRSKEKFKCIFLGVKIYLRTWGT